MLYIGPRIRRARKEAGLTQQQLANRISVDRAMVIHYEKEKHAIPYATLERLADVVGKSPAWFFLRDGESISPANEKEPREASPLEALEVLRAFVVQAIGTEQAADKAASVPEARTEDAGDVPTQNPDVYEDSEVDATADAVTHPGVERGRRKAESAFAARSARASKGKQPRSRRGGLPS